MEYLPFKNLNNMRYFSKIRLVKKLDFFPLKTMFSVLRLNGCTYSKHFSTLINIKYLKSIEQ